MQLTDNYFGIGIWSQDHEKLARWYEEVLGFKVRDRQNLPNDTFIDFDFGENYFFIGKHSEVAGKNRDPYRIMIGFNVKSVEELYQELVAKNVIIIAKPFEAPTGGFWCMTVSDPDGNTLQFYSNNK